MDEEIERMMDEGCPNTEPKRRYIILTMPKPTLVIDFESLVDEDYSAQNEAAGPWE